MTLRSSQYAAILFALAAAACSPRIIDLDLLPHDRTPSPVDPTTPEATDPQVLVTLDEVVHSVTADEARVYWSAGKYGAGRTHESLRSCLKDDCAHTIVTYAEADLDPHARGNFAVVAVHDGTVYWTEQFASRESPYQLRSCPVTGCTGEPTLVELPDNASAAKVDEGALYLVAERTDPVSPDAGQGGSSGGEDNVPDAAPDAGPHAPGSLRLWRCELADCAQSWTDMGSFAPHATLLAVHDGNVFWSEVGLLVTRPLADVGSVRVLTRGAPAPTNPTTITVRGQEVYWGVCEEPGNIERCSLDAPCLEPKHLARNRACPTVRDVDATGVYFEDVLAPNATTEGTPLLRCPISGCKGEPEVITANTFGTAFDADTVYWVTTNTAQFVEGARSVIRRTPRPPTAR